VETEVEMKCTIWSPLLIHFLSFHFDSCGIQGARPCLFSSCMQPLKTEGKNLSLESHQYQSFDFRCRRLWPL
jgi:hypothetical protein